MSSAQIIESNLQPVGAPFLFIMSFLSMMPIIRKLCFRRNKVQYKIKGLSEYNIGVPRKMIFQDSSNVVMDSTSKSAFWSMFQWVFGFIITLYASVLPLYQALKKYNSIKYTVSFSRAVSRLTGFFCSLYLPKPFRYILCGGFAKIYGINMDEVEHPDFGHYETFTLFFTRHLKKGVRTIEQPKDGKSMCSPCDGTVLTCGKINSEFSTIDCVKGRSYRLDEFMLGIQGNTNKRDHCDKIENNSEIEGMLEKVKQRGN